MRFEFEVNLKKVHHIEVRKEIKIQKEPSLRRSLILAYQIQELFDNGKATSLKQVATWLHMTYARISQIMNLLFLAPDIQEEILLSDKEAIKDLTEHKIRKIAIEPIWQKQRELWKIPTKQG